MREKIKNIFNLSKIFIKENENKIRLINNRKIDKTSGMFWIYIILLFGIIYISSEVVSYIINLGKPEIFLSGFLLFLNILILIRTTIVSINVLYFSKDIENILHLPIKPLEILIAKFMTILLMTYELETIFGLIPLLLYGIYAHMTLMFFVNLFILLIIFPIFATIIISIITMFLMKTIKLFRNKDIMQSIITFALVFVIMIFINFIFNNIFNNIEDIKTNKIQALEELNNKITDINKYFITIEPSREILQNTNLIKILFNYFKIIIISLISFLLFIFIGNKLYLKQLLKANFYYKKKKNKKIKLNNKKNSIREAYIKKEIKMLYKNPIFFIQSIYPVIILTIIICVLLIFFVPQIRIVLQGEEYKDIIKDLKFDIEAVCIIIGAIQVVCLFNYTSITAISREGKNAYIMKYLPISLYKQIIYKSVPQILLNTICSIGILVTISVLIPEIALKYIFMMGIISILLIVINSLILVLIDLVMPKLEWDAEYEILKSSNNKLLQYALIVFNILFLIFINKLFNNHNLDKSLYAFMGGVTGILIIINYIIWKFRSKLFKKIK